MNISKLVASQEKQLLKLLGGLISKDTTNPPGNEWKAADVVKKFFRKEKIKYKVFEKEKGRTNVIGYIGKGKPRIILATHFDIVHPGDGWKTNPFKMTIKGDKIYGRGVADNKGPMAAILIAGKILKKYEKKLNGQIVIACVADEEKGSKKGMYYLLNEKKIDGECAIVPDAPVNMKKITVTEKGILHLKITSFGKQAHGSTPNDGINAVWNMIDFLNVLRKYKMKFKKHPLFKGPTMNLGAVNGGYIPNMVPGKCETLLDFRYLPGQTSKEIVKDIRDIIKKIEKKNSSAKFKIEIKDTQKSFEFGDDNELIKSIKDNTEKIIGIRPTITGSSGTTVSKPLAYKGIFSAGFCLGDDVFHKTGENISKKQLIDFTNVICLVLLDILG